MLMQHIYDVFYVVVETGGFFLLSMIQIYQFI